MGDQIPIRLDTKNRDKRFRKFKQRINEPTMAGALDKAVQIANKFLDMKEEIEEKWSLNEK